MPGKKSSHHGKHAENGDRAAPPQPRAFWSGVISFGLVSVPVSLFPANRAKPVALKMVDREGTPLRRRFYCEKENKALENDDIVRGYPIEKDRFVTVEDEELEALAPDKTREIDLNRFVPLNEINPVYFERGYFLAPESGGNKAYRLLAKSMEDEKRAGIATFVMRDREYVVAIIAERGILRAETLRFHDEIRSPEDVGLPVRSEANKKQVSRMRKAIESLSAKSVDRSMLEDRDARRIRELVKRKLKAGGDVLKEAEAEEGGVDGDSNVIDLMQILKERLQGDASSKKSGREQTRRHSRTGGKKRPGKEVETLNRKELYERARELHIAGRSKMTKRELVVALKKAG